MVNHGPVGQRARTEPGGVASAPFQRIVAGDPEEDRPPLRLGKPLTVGQIGDPGNLLPSQLFRRRADWFRQTRAFSIDKAVRELGFVARVPLAEGLRRTAVWYREHGYLR